LVTSHYDHDLIPELPPEWLAHEYYEDDFHKMADVARSQRGLSSLHETTGGDPSRSPGWRLYIEPYGAEQELLVALRTQPGLTFLGLTPRRPGTVGCSDRSTSAKVSSSDSVAAAVCS
jgi:hypothetical protein